MNRFVACVCVGLIIPLYAPDITAEDGSGQRFIDVTRSAGVVPDAQGKGVAIVDFDEDGDLDIFVTGRGPAHAGLGVDIADFDVDGWPDLFVAGTEGEARLYRNDGKGIFKDITRQLYSQDPVIETIKIEGGRVEITGQSIKVEGGKVEIVRRRP